MGFIGSLVLHPAAKELTIIGLREFASNKLLQLIVIFILN